MCTLPAASPWKRWLPVIGLALLAGLVAHFGWRKTLDLLLEARRLPLGGMCLLILAGFWLRAWKWRCALGPGSNAIGLFFLAKMAGNWSPGRIGELAPLLLRRHRTPRVAAWIVADRVLEVAFTLALGLLGAAWLSLLTWPITMALFLTGGGIFAAGGALAVQPALLPACWRNFPEGSRRHQLAAFAAQLRQETRTLGRRAPAILLLTLTAKFTDIYTVVLLCRAFGYEASFPLVCAARCAHALVSGIPMTPDATGVPYAAAAYLLHEYAHMPYAVLTAALGLEVTLINGLLWASFGMGLLDLREPRPDARN